MRRPLACLFFVAHAAAVAAQEPLPPGLKGGEKLAALIQRVSQVQSGMASLQSRFEQVRKSHLLVEPSVSRGTFYYVAPDRVRWEYETPRPMTVLLVDGVATTYRPDEKRAEQVEVGRMQRRVFRFIGAGEPLEKLRRHFAFTFTDPGDEGNYRLTLTPTTRQIGKRLKSVELQIDRTRMIPVVVSYSDADSDTTTYSFSGIELNRTIDPGLFRLELPADVKVVQVKVSHGD